MPSQLETIVQRMIDAGEPEENIAAVIQQYKPPQTPANLNPQKPGMMDTFAGGVLKSIGSGEMQNAMMQGGLGYLKGMALAVPKGLAGLASIGKGLVTDPGQTISDIGTGLADMPGHMVNTFRQAGSDPMAFGEMMGELSGAPASVKVPGIAARAGKAAAPGVARTTGKAISGVGKVMEKHQPLTGFLPRFADMRTLRNIERTTGRGISKVGESIRRAGTPVVDAEIVPPMGPPWTEGTIVPETPRGLLPESPVDIFQPPSTRPVGPALTSAVEMEAPSSISGNMPSPVSRDWANTVLQATETPGPERVWNMPQPISGYLDTRVPELNLPSRGRQFNLPERTIQPGESINLNQFGPTGMTDEQLIQGMSGRPAPDPIQVEIDSLLQKLETTRNPQSVINRPTTAVNASGESAASQEAINRIASMKQKGESFVVYDKAGRVKPLIGPDAVDYVAKPGETYGVRGPEGFRVLDDKGGKVPTTSKKPTKQPEPTTGKVYRVTKEKFTPELLSKSRSKGFEFIGQDSFGNFLFRQTRPK